MLLSRYKLEGERRTLLRKGQDPRNDIWPRCSEHLSILYLVLGKILIPYSPVQHRFRLLSRRGDGLDGNEK